MNPRTNYRAIVCDSLGPPENLLMRLLPRPALRPHQVRVAVHAAGLNFPDVLMIQGHYQHKPELPFVPGLEAAGEIIEVGGEVHDRRIGERVMVKMRTGAFAEEATVPATDVTPVPAGFSAQEAATFQVGHITSYHALVTRGGLRPGQTLLVLGAAGGVGLAAVEIGKVLGARVIAVASTREKRALTLEKGADAAIDPAAAPLAQAVKALTGGKGVDIVMDPVGIAGEDALRCVRFGGRVLLSGFAGGSIPDYAANRILLKGAHVIGVRAGEAARHDPDMRREEMRQLIELAADGRLRPFVSQSFPLPACAKAMRALLDRQAVGRIALTTF